MSGETIITRAASIFEIDPAALCGEGRSWHAAHARQAAYYALRQEGWTLRAIGAIFRRDHQTVLHGVQVATRRAVNDPAYARKLAELLPDQMGGVA